MNNRHSHSCAAVLSAALFLSASIAANRVSASGSSSAPTLSQLQPRIQRMAEGALGILIPDSNISAPATPTSEPAMPSEDGGVKTGVPSLWEKIRGLDGLKDHNLGKKTAAVLGISLDAVPLKSSEENLEENDSTRRRSISILDPVTLDGKIYHYIYIENSLTNKDGKGIHGESFIADENGNFLKAVYADPYVTATFLDGTPTHIVLMYDSDPHDPRPHDSDTPKPPKPDTEAIIKRMREQSERFRDIGIKNLSDLKDAFKKEMTYWKPKVEHPSENISSSH